jgi:hypothetical protein
MAGMGSRPASRRRWPAPVGEQARDDFGAAGLEAANRVRRLELHAHRAPEVERRLQRDTASYGVYRKCLVRMMESPFFDTE